MSPRIIFSILLLTLFSHLIHAQTNINSSPILQKAHNKKITRTELQFSDNQQFLFSVYNVKKALTNTTHHWFIKLTDIQSIPLNNAFIRVTGYLKNDPSVKLNHQGVIALCTQGKYIIGFVKVQQSGTWVLHGTIDNLGNTDTFVEEIEIQERQNKP